MIDKLTYDQVLTFSKELKNQAEIINNLFKNKDNQALADFIATVEGYSKFLENSVEINKDADIALLDLKKIKK